MMADDFKGADRKSAKAWVPPVGFKPGDDPYAGFDDADLGVSHEEFQKRIDNSAPKTKGGK